MLALLAVPILFQNTYTMYHVIESPLIPLSLLNGLIQRHDRLPSRVIWILGRSLTQDLFTAMGVYRAAWSKEACCVNRGFENSNLTSHMGSSWFCALAHVMSIFFPPVAPLVLAILDWDAMFARRSTLAFPDVCIMNCFMAFASHVCMYIYIFLSIYRHTYKQKNMCLNVLFYLRLDLIIHSFMYLFVYLLCMQQITSRWIKAH